ncbi:modulator of FtsH protease HflK [Desulfovibrionales bacterium]
MNWDWDRLQERRQRQGGLESSRPDFEKLSKSFRRFFTGGNISMITIFIALFVLWLLAGIYIVDPAEVGVVLRFGAFHRITDPGPHYHWPYPIEQALTPNVTQIRRVEVGFRSIETDREFLQGQLRLVPEESFMLTGDENIVDVQFIVQYQIKDPKDYLFNVADPAATLKNAAEAAMREVIGYNDIDSALTVGKLEIQNQTQRLLQQILNHYGTGLRVVAVQLQDVHPPKEVVDAFKDVANAREDKSRFNNEADAYRNDLIPRTRGQAVQLINQATAYRESVLRKAQGESARFLLILDEYNKAKDITRERLYLEAMEQVLTSSGVEKIILSDKALEKAVPHLLLERFFQADKGKAPERKEEEVRP